jgi:hypothetical protein
MEHLAEKEPQAISTVDVRFYWELPFVMVIVAQPMGLHAYPVKQ